MPNRLQALEHLLETWHVPRTGRAVLHGRDRHPARLHDADQLFQGRSDADVRALGEGANAQSRVKLVVGVHPQWVPQVALPDVVVVGRRLARDNRGQVEAVEVQLVARQAAGRRPLLQDRAGVPKAAAGVEHLHRPRAAGARGQDGARGVQPHAPVHGLAELHHADHPGQREAQALWHRGALACGLDGVRAAGAHLDPHHHGRDALQVLEVAGGDAMPRHLQPLQQPCEARLRLEVRRAH
mmetsp:Transcript_24834/g.68173  ORF Transcript_24834/g.68173 Transcript_24834/m.68173 type:complete len:240 (-) Transcript_24834:428-1147(-)